MESMYTELPGGLKISRVITGLWQVADAEKGGGVVEASSAADVMEALLDHGLHTLDMADHYGSAEDITGVLLQRRGRSNVVVLTKWCPSPGAMDEAVVRDAVKTALQRMGTTHIDLLQFHWWCYEDPRYLDALVHLHALQKEGLIRHLGLTNFNAPHLRVVLTSGIPIVCNQVCYSLLDRRASSEMADVCRAFNVRLLAYGTLAGGLLTDGMLGKGEEQAFSDEAWSLAKYRRFMQAGGATWEDLQGLLQVLQCIANKHTDTTQARPEQPGVDQGSGRPSEGSGRVSVANVAARWVLQQEGVAAVIVGSHLKHTTHIHDNLRILHFELDAADLMTIADYLGAHPCLGRLPHVDCGDEYRHAPYLTASGDLSHHLTQHTQHVYTTQRCASGSVQVTTGTLWEELAQYSRAIRRGHRIAVSGTTSTHGSLVVSPHDAEAQATFILDKIHASLTALGGDWTDVLRTRIFLRHAERDWRGVCKAHARCFRDICPANTLVQATLVGEHYLVEIELDAEVLQAEEA